MKLHTDRPSRRERGAPRRMRSARTGRVAGLPLVALAILSLAASQGDPLYAQTPIEPVATDAPAVPAVDAAVDAAAEATDPAAPEAEILVRQVTADTVYLDAGRADGLVKGQKVRIVRGNEEIALLEITFLADGSAAARILESPGEVAAGDRAIPLAPPPAPVTGTEGAKPEPESPPRSRRPARAEPEPILIPPRPRRTEKEPWADLSGSISLRYQQIDDRTDFGSDLAQTTLRANLYLSEIGGTPYELRLRARGRESTTTRASGEAESERRDRLYEAALIYDPLDGRYSYQLGRLVSGPLIGFDYLDGFLGEYRFTPSWGVGGFYGSRSVIEGLDFEGAETAYGLFVHYRDRTPGKTYYSEVSVGAIGEYDQGEVSREYLSIYGRQGSGSRWSLYERADVEYNRDWRQEASGTQTEVSNVLLTGTYRISDGVRLGVSYDQRRRVRTLDDRDTPEERFDDRLRQGWRLTTYLGTPRSLRLIASVGLRSEEDNPEDNVTVNGSLYHSNVFGWNLLAGLDFSSFDGDSSKGSRAGVRLRKYFRRGHDVGLTAGTAETTIFFSEETRTEEWVRLSGTVQLPKRFYFLGEVELVQGDEQESQRLFLQLGYRL